jgi:hypothetical protein
MTEVYLKLLGVGLDLWQDHNKTKYVKKYNSLVRKIRDENKKSQEEIDLARLDELEFELQLLCDSFITTAKRQNTSN